MLWYDVYESNAQRFVKPFDVFFTVRQPGRKLGTRTAVAFRLACCLALAKDRRCLYFIRQRPSATIKHTACTRLHHFFVKFNSSTFFARICTLLYTSWNRGRPRVERLDSGHARQATVKCGRERQEGDMVATGRRQGGDRKTTGQRQESGREATGSDRQATGRRQGRCDRRATGGRQGGDRVATGRRQGSDRKQDIATGYATGKRQEDDRRATGLAATGKRQGSDR